MDQEYNSDTLRHCPNCDTELTSESHYCPKCGQKTGPILVTIRDVIRDFFDSVFNFDSRFFVTLKKLFIPGYLTREFFKGRQVRYVNPLRLFFVSLIGMYTVLGFTHFKKVEADAEASTPYHEYRARTQAIDMIRQARSMVIADPTLSESQIAAIDSLEAAVVQMPPEAESRVNIGLSSDSTLFLSTEEVYGMDIDSVYKRHNITGFFEKIITHQVIRMQREPAKALNSLIANSTWMILLLMPVLALVLKLLYWRRKLYYVQHLVFLFHYHAAVFIGLMVYFMFVKAMPVSLAGLIPLLFIGFLLAAMKRYYSQGWGKTILKFCLLTTSYLLTFIMFFLTTIVISLLVF